MQKITRNMHYFTTGTAKRLVSAFASWVGVALIKDTSNVGVPHQLPAKYIYHNWTGNAYANANARPLYISYNWLLAKACTYFQSHATACLRL